MLWARLHYYYCSSLASHSCTFCILIIKATNSFLCFKLSSHKAQILLLKTLMTLTCHPEARGICALYFEETGIT